VCVEARCSANVSPEGRAAMGKGGLNHGCDSDDACTQGEKRVLVVAVATGLEMELAAIIDGGEIKD